MKLHLPPGDVTIYNTTAIKAGPGIVFYPVNEKQYHERVFLIAQMPLCSPVKGTSEHMYASSALRRWATERRRMASDSLIERHC